MARRLDVSELGARALTRCERFGRLLPFVLVVGLLLARPALPVAGAGATTVVAGAPTTQVQLGNGAVAMKTALVKGFGFTVVSRSVLQAKPGGPLVEIPDPADPYKVAGTTDHYYLGASAARGVVRGADFTLQMYGGATTEAEPVDLAALQPTLAALLAGGKAWRNDGVGWYATTADLLPGIGLDPQTIALLPTLLGHAAKPVAATPTLLAGRSLPTVTASGAVADAPGLMATDAASFTVFAQPLSFAFDEQGRIAQLTAVMRNTRMTDVDLLVTSTITFDYASTAVIPAPDPTAPPPTPSPDPAAASATPGATR